jgi:hypothetical protein
MTASTEIVKAEANTRCISEVPLLSTPHLTGHCSGLAAQRCSHAKVALRLAAEFGRYAA